MATDRTALARSLGGVASDLARRWARQQATAVQGYGHILAGYGAGRDTGRATAEALARLAAAEVARYPADAFKLWSDYVTAIVGRTNARPSGAMPPSPTVLDIDLAGPLAGIASREFVLENPHHTAASIALVAGSFTHGDIDVAVRPSFHPAIFTLPAQQERQVEVQVALDPSSFQSGRSYVAHVAASGFDDLILRLHLTVTDPA